MPSTWAALENYLEPTPQVKAGWKSWKKNTEQRKTGGKNILRPV